MNIFIKTYGCSNNIAESEMMAGLLSRSGFNIVENEKIADIIIINTCVVKRPTLDKIVGYIKKISKTDKKIIIAGCLPELNLTLTREIAKNASMISTHRVKDIVKVTTNLINGKILRLTGKQNKIKLGFPRIKKNKVITIIPISSGCFENCSYCIVKKVKGELFSFPKNKILEEIKKCFKEGSKEIWITSQDNASYGLDNKKIRLPELLEYICNLPNKNLIRTGMMNPSNVKKILDDLIRIYKNDKIFKFLHIPVQSGSNKILKLMNRNYSIQDFLEIVNKFKKEIPDITIATDIIVGFPGETKEDFKKTLNLIKKIEPDVLNTSKFWPMPGTEASKMKQLPLKMVKKRADKLMKMHAKIGLNNNKKLIGKEYLSFVDEKNQDGFIARNINYRTIFFKSKDNVLGKYVKLRINKIAPHYLIGKLVS